MAKKVFAVTNIKIGTDDYWSAGSEVDHSKFTGEQLKELIDAGAMELRIVEDTPGGSEVTSPEPEALAAEEVAEAETPEVTEAETVEATEEVPAED